MRPRPPRRGGDVEEDRGRSDPDAGHPCHPPRRGPLRGHRARPGAGPAGQATTVPRHGPEVPRGGGEVPEDGREAAGSGGGVAAGGEGWGGEGEGDVNAARPVRTRAPALPR